jgi:LacI family transcriptional regulator
MARGQSSITITGIARLAGVAKGTVSKVLNNYRGINEKTRERVLKIVRDMGYEPNSAAQTLVSRRSGNIGLIIPHAPEHSLTGAYWSSLVSAITLEATRSGYSLVLLLPHEEGRLHELFKSTIRTKRVDGLIVGAELLDKHYLTTLLSMETRFVMLGQNPAFRHHCVDVDNRHAGASIASYLIQRGYRRPMFVGGPREYHMADRAAGFQEAVRAARLEPTPLIFTPYEDRPAMEKILSEAIRNERPDGIVVGAGGDFMLDALSILEALGLRPPECGFATFDDYRYLELFKPPITAVSQPIGQLGAEAVKILIELLESEETALLPDRCTILPTSIIPRGSCGEKETPASEGKLVEVALQHLGSRGETHGLKEIGEP